MSAFQVAPLPFVVLEFPDETPITVEAVPSGWLISANQCRYPSGRVHPNSLHKLLRDQNSKPQDSWGTSRCKILGNFGKSST